MDHSYRGCQIKVEYGKFTRPENMYVDIFWSVHDCYCIFMPYNALMDDLYVDDSPGVLRMICSNFYCKFTHI